MTYLEAKSNLCSLKLNINYADLVAGLDALLSLQDIEDAITYATSRATERHPWPFLESTQSITLTSAESYDYDLFPESPFLIVVNGIPWSGEGKGKRNFTDYMKWRSDYASDNSQIWSEYGGLLYVNPNAFASGQTMVVYGLVGFPIPSSDSDPLPFELLSDEDSASGDQAIILLAYANLLASEKKKNPQGAAAAATEAYNLLDTLWLIIAERRAQKQPQNRPFFNVDDYYAKSNRPTCWDTKIANFP